MLGALVGAVAGALLAGIGGGASGFAFGAYLGFGTGAAIGWAAGSFAGMIVGALVGVVVAAVRAEGDPHEAVPEALLFGFLGGIVGFFVVGALVATWVGAQYALSQGADTAQAWAVVAMPWGAWIGAAAGVAGGIKVQTTFDILSFD